MVLQCDRYWPYDTRPVYYGDIAVTALNESRYPDWTITELMVCRGSEQRVLKHFHFTTWPDFGVPDPPTTLARSTYGLSIYSYFSIKVLI